MKRQDNKIKLIIGILLLLVLISASTYAYFKSSTVNNFGTRNITGKFDNTGNVTLSTGNNLVLNLTNEQMLEKTSDVTYYASSTGAKTEETIENIGTAQVVGEETYNCSYKIKVEDKSDNSIYTAFQSMEEKSDGQITLIVNGTAHELNTANMFPLTIDGELRGLTKDAPQNITASFKIVNKKEIDQSAIANTDINLSFTVEEFTCNNHTEETGAEYLIRTANLWQSGLEGDGYRFVGNNTDTNPNNYICFGTTDKTACTGNTDAYMYRIIGVFPDGNGNQHIKLIKKEALETAYTWNDTNSDVDWNTSTLYNNLNGSSYLTNTTYIPDSTWKSRIANWTWRATNTLTNEKSGTSYYYTSPQGIYQNEILKIENSNITCANSSDTDGTIARCAAGELTTPNAKIGLMYASDYALSLGDEALSLTTGTYTNRAKLKTGWMHLLNNDSETPNATEWTISRYGMYSSGNYYEWYVRTSGGIDNLANVANKHSIRPTFYLNSDETIASGTGTLEDPYILGA